jgi:hypothetical protein
VNRARRALTLPAFFLTAAVNCGTPAPQGTIVLDSLLTIGDTAGPGFLPSHPRGMARDSSGRFILTLPWAGEEPPFVFGSDGRFLARVGGVGEGPGEFRRPQLAFVGASDSLFFVDRQVARLTVYDAELRFVRTAPFPLFSDAVRLPDGSFVITTLVGPTSFVLQRVGADGTAGARFGQIESPCPRIMCGSTDPRRLSVTSDGRLWAAWWMLRYRISEWSPDGTELSSLAPRSDWFEPYDQPSNPAPDTPPNPMVNAVGQDSAGRVWVLGKAANPRWQDAFGGTFVSEGQRLHRVTGRLYDGIVEVLDPRSGTRLALHRFDRDPWFWLPGDLIGAVRQSPEGTILVDVYRVSYSPGSP